MVNSTPNSVEWNSDRPHVRKLFADLANEYSGKLVLMPDKPEETVENNLRALWLRAADIRISSERAMWTPLPELNPDQLELLQSLLEQRRSGVPLAYLTGRQHFMGLEFICTKDALIPRKETEILANASIELLQKEGVPSRKDMRVLDLCCGSGNVAISIASRVPSSTVIGADLSAEAVELATQNAKHLECNVTFCSGDLFEPVDSREFYASFDLITCNPPYISTGKLSSMPLESIGYEPRMAFDGGPLGAGILWRVLDQAPRFIKPGGWLAFEAGLAQGPGMLRRLSNMFQYTNVRAVCDKAGNPRAILSQATGHADAALTGPPPESKSEANTKNTIWTTRKRSETS